MTPGERVIARRSSQSWGYLAGDAGTIVGMSDGVVLVQWDRDDVDACWLSKNGVERVTPDMLPKSQQELALLSRIEVGIIVSALVGYGILKFAGWV